MAEWKSRGYVPDSDEDDGTSSGSESQEQGQKNQSSAAHSACVIDTAEGTTEHHNRRLSHGSPDVHSAENTTLEEEKKEATNVGWNILFSSQEVDELHERHHQTASDSLSQLNTNRDSAPQSKINDIPSEQILLSSLFTTLPLSPKEPSPPVPSQGRADNRHVAVVISGRDRERLRDQTNPQQVIQRSEIPTEHPIGRTRNLRHRNPIQLHPYALEQEKYRQVLQNRGIIPLRIAQGESQSLQDLAEDSQAGVFDSDAENQEATRVQSRSSSFSSLESLVRPSLSPRDAFGNVHLEDDDLPDVDVILRQAPAQIAFNGHKRRKVTRSHSEQARSTDAKGHPFGTTNADQSLFDIPLSPPKSQTESPSSSLTDRRGFRIPRGISPVTLPTPVTSSEPRRRRTSVASVSPPERSSSIGTSSGNESENSTNEPAIRLHGRLEGASRKIRGVLPASWLKLDLQAQAKLTKYQPMHNGSLSPEKDIVQQRGVARPVAPRYKAPKASETPIQIIDSSSDADSDQELWHTASTKHPSHPRKKPRGAFLSDFDELPVPSDLWDDVDEDNRIDTMAPAASRQRTVGRLSQGLTSKKKTRKQTRLPDMRLKDQRSTPQEPPGLSKPRGDQRLRPVHSPSRSRGAKLRPPNLSLLDVPSPRSSVAGFRPFFIRVAQRTARLRNDKGRSAPDHKRLHMATDVETQEANEYLHSWREGNLRTRTFTQSSEAATVANCREPLQPCSGNQRPTTLEEPKDSVVPKPKPRINARLGNKALDSTRPRGPQISLDHMTAFRSRVREQPDSGTSRQVHRNSDVNLAHKGPVRAGHLVSSFKDPDQSRPATLESLQANIDRERPLLSFGHHLDRTTQEIAPRATANPLLSKFLEDYSVLPSTTSRPRAEHRNDPASENPVDRIRGPRPRKRKPQRKEIRQSRASIKDTTNADEIDPPVRESHTDVTVVKPIRLIALGPYGTTYTTTFDIAPLPLGSYFTAGTFLGSGDFATSFIAGDLDTSRGFSSIGYGPSEYRWGPWNDQVSSQISTLIDQSCGKFQQTLQLHQDAFASMINDIIHLLGQIIRYFSTGLSFYDAIDRISFLQRCNTLVSQLVQELPGNPLQCDQRTGSDLPVISESQILSVKALTLCVVVASQLRQIAKHEVVPHTVQAVMKDLLQKTAAQALEYTFAGSSIGFVQNRERLKQAGSGSIVFDERHVAVELLVVVSHALAEAHSVEAIWPAMWSSVITSPLKSLNDVGVLDRCWERLLLILPFLEIDRQGVLEVGRRFKISSETWTTVKCFLEPVLAAYSCCTPRQAPALNEYCRAVFGRCFTLIHTWGWRKCESNIGMLFDFFAHRSLFNLPYEEVHGSPQFLSQLNHQAPLELVTEDRCFHIFLKITGSGLYQMRKIYSDKKIGGIVWRLLPNHGRFLPKDQVISQVDLDAMRNHHDLLCTLYWASPSGYRPKPSVIQSLVDLENSHKEACHINIRSWLYLVKFQLTAKEPLSSLQPFVEWLTDLFAQIVRQHQHARTEAEEQVRLVEASNGCTINRSLLESTIIQNQRQIEALLLNLLSSMEIAINAAPDLTIAKLLLIPGLVSVFELFRIRSPQTNKVILSSLDILLLFTAKAILQDQVTASGDKDDSQDYGDWSAFDPDALPMISATPEVAEHIEKCFHGPLRELLSNCFGADSPPEDALLTKVIEAWVAVGHIRVIEGTRSWADYIGDYGYDSWASLRDTEQTRKFSSYFLAVVVDTDKAVFREYKQHVLKSWIASLVERELLLKYQHRLTSSLLNADSRDFILANPPFWSVAGRFEITPAEFSERRLSLITNVLSNMRQSTEESAGSNAHHLRAEYKEILKIMMITMKSNYQELGQGSSIRGAYVDFVHRVIELLQQHTSSICPIDRFFTDSSSFPLPAHDPTYVVGQLKNYGLRLQEQRTPKQLAMFVQSVSERAAVDGQQDYLVSQLSTAMSSNERRDVIESSGLRSFLIGVVFPAYIDVALSTASGWIMATPILQAIRKVFSSIMPDVNGTDQRNIISVLNMVTGFLDCLWHSIELLVDHPGYMNRPKTLKTVGTYFAIITAVMPALDYTCRISRLHGQADVLVESFESFAIFAAGSLLGQAGIDVPIFHRIEAVDDNNKQHREVRAFAVHELRETLNRNWVCQDETYFVNRGQTRREIVIDIGFFEEEKISVLKELARFFNVLERMSVLRRRTKM